MDRALGLAREAQADGDVPVGAVVMDASGTVIGEGRNRREVDADPTGHAEIVAMRAAARALGSWNLDGCTLVVTLEPCLMCASALRQIGIQRVVYGAGNERFGGNGSVLPLQSTPELAYSPPYVSLGGYLREEAILILRQFYLTENTKAPKPKAKAKRVLKTEIAPPGVSMHAVAQGAARTERPTI